MTDQPDPTGELAHAVATLTTDQRAGLARTAHLSAECLAGTPAGRFWHAVAGVIESPDEWHGSALRAACADLPDDARRDLAVALRGARNLVAVSSRTVADLWDEVRRVVLESAGQEAAA